MHIGLAGLIIIGACLIFALGLAAAVFLNRWGKSASGAKIRKLGKQAEKDAVRLLEEEGFRVMKTEPRIRHKLRVNGKPVAFHITPDFLVEKDGQRYVVEVKREGGVQNASVRRQALEYMEAAQLPCLLVIMPGGYIDLIETEAHFKANS